MEREYTWSLQAAEGSRKALGAAELIAPHVRGTQDISMNAVYYDTPDGLLGAQHAALRVRRENGRGVCCLKVPLHEGGYAEREEYEVEATDVHDGLAALPGAGAPRELCAQLARAQLLELCETRFERRAFALDVAAGALEGACGEAAAAFAAELAFDEGVLCRQGRTQQLHEMELEHTGGSIAAFHAFAAVLEGTLVLAREPLSKLARALRV